MKLWTIQNIDTYTEFKNTGILKANEKYIEDDMLFQYDWIVNQMVKRIGKPLDNNIKYPIWAWYQWNGENQKRPDLRCSGHLNPKTKGILLEIEVDEKDVLLSDFDDFNNIFNYAYICDSEESYDNFYKELKENGLTHLDLQDMTKQSNTLNNFRQRLYKSWEQMFDFNKEVDESWHGKKEDRSIQATMWQVKWEQVVFIKEFIAK